MREGLVLMVLRRSCLRRRNTSLRPKVWSFCLLSRSQTPFQSGHDDDPDYDSYVFFVTICFLFMFAGLVNHDSACLSRPVLRP